MAEQIKLRALQEKLENVSHQNNKLKQVYGELLKQKLSTNKKNVEFWDDIECRNLNDLNNYQHIKSMIRRKKLDIINDTNNLNQTLLLKASYSGSYQITKLCLNLGSNIDHLDKYDKSAFDLSKECKWHHIEQLLLFNKCKYFNVETSKQELIKISNKINTQNSIIKNILNQLSKYDSITKNFFQDTLTDLMINLISNKLSFSDLLLNLCWHFEMNEQTPNNQHASRSLLWRVLIKTCDNIIKSGNDRDWHWLKTFVIPSTVKCMLFR